MLKMVLPDKEEETRKVAEYTDHLPLGFTEQINITNSKAQQQVVTIDSVCMAKGRGAGMSTL